MNSASVTNFLNVKNRRIYQGKLGGFFIMKDGKKMYKPTAVFRQVGANGTKTRVTAANVNVPGAIKRKVRSNAGVKRAVTKNVSVTKPKSPRPQNKKAMKGRQFGNLDDFRGQVKILKDLAKGKGPVKAPGHYSSDVEVKGRDGKMWRTFRVYHIDEQGDERYELVWIRDMSQDDRSRYM